MRTFVVIAASLALAGAGVLAAGQDTPKPAAPKVQAEKESQQTKTKRKTVVVERDDQGGPPRVFSWDENGDAPVVPGLMLPAGPRIGVTVANLDDEQAKAGSGVTVTDVREDGPAAKAGVKEKDVITEFDGERVRSARQLTRLVGETPAGRSVRMSVMRDGKRLDVQVTPEEGERPMAGGGYFRPGPRGEGGPWGGDRMPRLHPGHPGERRFFFNAPEGERFFEFDRPDDGTFEFFAAPGRGRLGVGVQELSEQLAEYFGTKDGVLVTSVTKDSPAAKAGLRAGDVITSVDDAPVTSTRGLIESVQKAADGGSLKLGYVRDKKPGTATATLEAAAEKPKMKREAKPI